MSAERVKIEVPARDLPLVKVLARLALRVAEREIQAEQVAALVAEAVQRAPESVELPARPVRRGRWKVPQHANERLLGRPYGSRRAFIWSAMSSRDDVMLDGDLVSMSCVVYRAVLVDHPEDGWEADAYGDVWSAVCSAARSAQAVKREPVGQRLRFTVLKRDGFKCRYCGRKAPAVVLEVDHIVPVAAGGTNELDNLVTACEDCNGGKSDIPL